MSIFRQKEKKADDEEIARKRSIRVIEVKENEGRLIKEIREPRQKIRESKR